MTDPAKKVVGDIQEAMKTLEHLILSTPTGDKRNALCDANIHLTCALGKMVSPEATL